MKQATAWSKWLDEQVAIFVLWTGVVSMFIGQLFRILHWAHSLVFFAISVVAGVYVWSTIWKKVNQSEPKNQLDLFFLLILLSAFPQFLGLLYLPHAPIWTVVAWNGLLLIGMMGIWVSSSNIYGLKLWFCLSFVTLHWLILVRGVTRHFFSSNVFEWVWVSRAQFILSMSGYVILTMVLKRANKWEVLSIKDADYLIYEIGQDETDS